MTQITQIYYRFSFLFLLLTFLIVACTPTNETDGEKRIRYAATNTNTPIYIGVSLGEEDDPEIDALLLAQKEINESGGILNRPLELIFRYNHYSPTEGKIIAQEFAADPKITAVIGPTSSGVAIPTAPIFEFAQLPMVTFAATNPRLTEQGFQYIFRNVPSDSEVGKQLAEFAKRQRYQKIMILNEKGLYGIGLANVFEKHAQDAGITILDRTSYLTGERNFQSIVDIWQTLSFDAIFIGGSNPESAYFIEQARKAGITQPIMGGDGLASEDLIEIAGQAAEGIIIASYYHPDQPEEVVSQFNKTYQENYDQLPNVWEAQAYDALKLVASAIEEAGSTDPEKLIEKLHHFEWSGTTGHYHINEHGDVVGKSLILTQVKEGKFAYFLTLYSTNTVSVDLIEDEDHQQIFIAMPPGGKNDASYYELIWKGTINAAEETGFDLHTIEYERKSDFITQIKPLLTSNPTFLITADYLFEAELLEFASIYTDTIFVMVDTSGYPEMANLVQSEFAVDEAAFLAGYLAASVTKTGIVATYGGTDIPPVVRFMIGFSDGINYFNNENKQNVQLLGWNNDEQTGRFVGNYEQIEVGYIIASEFADAGADIILPVAGIVGIGTAQLAKERGILMIGTDSDWYFSAPDFKQIYLTSILKSVDSVPYTAITSFTDENYTPGTLLLRLSNKGVGLAPFHEQSEMVSEKLNVKLNWLTDHLSRGEIQTSWKSYQDNKANTP